MTLCYVGTMDLHKELVYSSWHLHLHLFTTVWGARISGDIWECHEVFIRCSK